MVQFISEAYDTHVQDHWRLTERKVQKDISSQSLSERFWQPPFLRALISCLQNLLPSVHQAHINHNYPSEAQKTALRILEALCNNAQMKNLQQLIDAGLIRDWLSHYPFASGPSYPMSDRLTRLQAVKQFMKQGEGSLCHTPELKVILGVLICSESGALSLVQAGLWDESIASIDEDRVERTRNTNEDAEETQRRRRRREAIVMGEEGRPIERRDIIQRDEGFRDQDAEIELENMLAAQTNTDSALSSVRAAYASLLSRVQNGFTRGLL